MRELVPGIELERLLDAIAAVESSGGVNNWPRLEAAYMPRGARRVVQGRILTGSGAMFNHVVRPRWERWGMASAASYSSWQILYHTAADRGYEGRPWALNDDEVARPYVVLHLELLARRGARSVRDFADAWNSGSHRDRIVPAGYIAKLQEAWDKARRRDQLAAAFEGRA